MGKKMVLQNLGAPWEICPPFSPSTYPSLYHFTLLFSQAQGLQGSLTLSHTQKRTEGPPKALIGNKASTKLSWTSGKVGKKIMSQNR